MFNETNPTIAIAIMNKKTELAQLWIKKTIYVALLLALVGCAALPVTATATTATQTKIPAPSVTPSPVATSTEAYTATPEGPAPLPDYMVEFDEKFGDQDLSLPTRYVVFDKSSATVINNGEGLTSGPMSIIATGNISWIENDTTGNHVMVTRKMIRISYNKTNGLSQFADASMRRTENQPTSQWFKAMEADLLEIAYKPGEKYPIIIVRAGDRPITGDTAQTQFWNGFFPDTALANSKFETISVPGLGEIVTVTYIDDATPEIP
jgi:hypothetical protein